MRSQQTLVRLRQVQISSLATRPSQLGFPSWNMLSADCRPNRKSFGISCGYVCFDFYSYASRLTDGDLDARYPDWFHPVSPDQVPSDLSPFEMLSIVLASATLFPTTSSRLSSVFDLPIPPTEGMTGLIQLQPRIDCLLVRQRKQDWEFLRLRQETAEMLERWYKTAILGVGECLAEWNSRLYLAERTVRRMEVARERQEKEG